MSFITRSGSQFLLDGQRYRFIGGNNYPLIHNSPSYTSSELGTFFGYCVENHISVIRTWCFDRTPYAGGGSGNVTGNFQYITTGSNTISNGSFETNTTGWSLGTEFTRSSESAQTGTWAIKQVSAGGFDNFTTTNDATGLAVTPNTDYRLSFYTKVALTSGSGPQIQVNSGSAYGTNLGVIGALIDTAGAFVQRTITFNSGANSKVWIRIFNNGGTNTVYYDNFDLSILPYMSWRESTFAQLDLVLERARAAGVRLSLVLSNGANEFTQDGSKQSYCRWNNQINLTAYGANDFGDAFHTDADIKARFKAYMSQLANRVNTVNGRTYKSDDTIFAWELINEGRYRNETYAGDSNSGTASSTFVTTMKTWYDEMADYLKDTLAVQQLVSTGGAGQYYDYFRGDPVHNNSSYGLDYQLDHTDASMDYADFHIYPYSDSSFKQAPYGAKLTTNTWAVTMTSVGTTVTVTLANHKFVVGQMVSIFDSSQADYDGTFTVVSTPSANTFTYTAASDPAVDTASGYARQINLPGLQLTLKEYADVAHTTLNKPVVCGEYGIVKGNTMTTNPLKSYPKVENHRQLLHILFNELDYDGIFLWHFTNLFDDDNFNIKPDGVHTGENANGNLNDDDTSLLGVIGMKSTQLNSPIGRYKISAQKTGSYL